jgi:hypothetical protein
MTVERVRIDEIRPDPANVRLHSDRNLAAIADSLAAFGQQKPIVVDARGIVVAGNGTREAALSLGWTEIDIVRTDLEGAAAVAFAIADNRTAELAAWDSDALAKTLASLDADLQIGWDDDDLASLLAKADGEEADAERETLDDHRPSPRDLPVDLIFTLAPANVACFIAAQAGWRIGSNSKSSGLASNRERWEWHHDLTFIDNEWHDYDHEAHLAVVGEFHPKYTTVRDLLTREQAAAAGVAYYSFDEVMRMAEEAEAVAENVIVIPKYDCIADIPEKYVLGYSVPSSYGATPLPIDRFRDRRVHLLGGSWRTQLGYLALLGTDVVSVDMNHVYNVARFGMWEDGEGKKTSLMDSTAGALLSNVIIAACTLSFGAIGRKVWELTGGAAGAEGDVLEVEREDDAE